MAKEEDTEEVAPVKKKSPVKLIIIIVVALVVVGGGVAGGLYFFGHKGGHEGAEGKKVAEEKVKPLVGPLWSLDPFIVNLADNQGERYLKVVMQLELSDQTVTADVEMLKPKIRDNILDLLSAKTYADLVESTGKQRLRDEIALRVNSFLTKGKIVNVYFTEFVVQ